MKNDLNKTHSILQKLLLLAVGFILLSAAFPGTLGWVILGIGACFAVAEIVIAWRYYRCPHCGAHLAFGQRAHHCYHCGKGLDT